MGDDQKLLKKRLKVLMNRPENQVCADCPERQPRWASLIVVPPGAPAGQQPIGAFVCLECSGSHRRLGVHIAFVRSINLDSWKEKEVLAMENGGNARVNSVFEGALTNPSIKPHNHADGPTRERFIRDKYERRRYYDANGFSATIVTVPSQPTANRSNSNITDASVGPPSDIARQRLEERRQRIKSGNSNDAFERSNSSVANPTTTTTGLRKSGRNGIAAAPSSAPVSVDLLDFGSNSNTIDSIATPVSAADDFFASSTIGAATTPSNSGNMFEANFSSDPPVPATAAPPRPSAGIDMFAFLTQDMKKDETQQQQQTTKTDMTKASPPSFGGDIMSLYGQTTTTQQPQAFSNPGMATMTSSMAGLNFDSSSNNGGHNVGMPGYGGVQQQTQQQPNQQQQQQMMMLMMQQQQQQNNQMMFNGNHNMMQQQQQQVQPQQVGNNMMMNQYGASGGMAGYSMGMQNQGGMNKNNNNNNNNNQLMMQKQFNAMPGYGTSSNGYNTNATTAFGTPMGMFPAGTPTNAYGNSNAATATSPMAVGTSKQKVPEKEDPFAQFGMNVFRA